MAQRIRRLAWPALSLIPAILAAGCAVVDSTVYMPGSLACEGPLGAYTLPKRVITAVVKESPAVANTKRRLRTISITGPTVIPDPDPRFSFCLNYLGSPFAEDAVAVSRTLDGLLVRVYSRVTDQ